MPSPLQRLEKVLEASVVALLWLLVALALFETLAWSLLHVSIPQLLEVQSLLLVWFTLLSAAWALPQGLHLALDWLPESAPEGLRRIADAVADALTGLFGLAYAIYGGSLAAAVTNTLPATGLPAATQYAAAAIAGGCIAVLAGGRGLARLRGAGQ